MAQTSTVSLLLIGCRHLRSNDSRLHNSKRLQKGPDRCTLMIHPDDAEARGIADRQRLDSLSGNAARNATPATVLAA